MDKKNRKYLEVIKKLFIIIFANSLCSLAINGFFIPNKLLSSGVGGASIMIEYLTGVPTGIIMFLINIPMFIFAFRKVDKDLAIYGFISMLAFSSILTFTKGIGEYIPQTDILVGAMVGGVINGTGVGILFKNGMCQSGLDILATVLKRRLNMNLGTTLMGVNTVIVALSSVLFEFRAAMYTIIAIFMSAKIVDKITIGLISRKNILIISDNSESLAEEIRNQLNRSVTFLEGMGSYKKENKKVIYLVVDSKEVVTLKNLVEEVDSDAFITISDVVEVRGSTFPVENI